MEVADPAGSYQVLWHLKGADDVLTVEQVAEGIQLLAAPGDTQSYLSQKRFDTYIRKRVSEFFQNSGAAVSVADGPADAAPHVSNDGGDSTQEQDVAFMALSMLASVGDDGEDSEEDDMGEDEDPEEEDAGDETVSKRPRTPPTSSE